MDDTENLYLYKDVSEELQTLTENQQAEIEQLNLLIEQYEQTNKHLEQINEHLEHQVSIQQEQINGFSMIIDYQHATIGFLVIVAAVVLGWNVLNKWFFRGC